MTVHDMHCIQTIIEEKSINKAAARLFVSQPALSKCVKKVESEYSITIFERTRGSALQLTEEGRLFQEMASSVLQAHRLFENRLVMMKTENRKTIMFASPMQRAYTISGPLMRWIYEHYPDYRMELKTIPSLEMEASVRAGVADLAVHMREVDSDDLYSREIFRSENYLYVRPGCPAAAMAEREPGKPYPVLSIKALAGEVFASNVPGTNSRRTLEQISKKAGVILAVRDEAVHSLRIAMVNAGHACIITSDDALEADPSIDRSRLFCLPQEEEIVSRGYIICRSGFQRDPRFRIICEAMGSLNSGRG